VETCVYVLQSWACSATIFKHRRTLTNKSENMFLPACRFIGVMSLLSDTVQKRSFIMIIKSRMMRWVKHVACMGKTRNTNF
jgi:hypothetical protein